MKYEYETNVDVQGLLSRMFVVRISSFIYLLSQLKNNNFVYDFSRQFNMAAIKYV
jgi:hypothetical protein